MKLSPESLLHYKDLKAKMNILSKLEYIDPVAMTLKLKGRIAAGVFLILLLK